MKKNKKIIVSAFSTFALMLNLFLPSSAWAYNVSLPSLLSPTTVSIDVNEILSEVNQTSVSSLSSMGSQSIEDRYGITSDILRTAKRKVSAPRMEIFFDNTNPKPGEKVTAHAVPEFFKNDPQNLYYTWYIIHTKDGTPQTAIGDNPIRDGKIEAAKLMARGDYDPDLDGQSYSDPGKDPDSDGWPAVDNSYDEDKTAAPMGGSDGVGGLPEETVNAYNTSAEWCDSLGGHSWSDCRYNDGDSFKPLNTYFTLNSSQTNHYCGLCTDYFSGDGATSYDSAKSARNNCCYEAIPEASLQCSSEDPDTHEITYFKCPYSAGTDYCGVTYNSSFENCYDTFESANKSTVNTCLNGEYDSCKTDWATVHDDFNGDGFSDSSGEDTTSISRCFKHNFGTSAGASLFRENELSGTATDDPSGLDYSTTCRHKWINAPDYKSGSGKFPTGEEKYWKTDPADPDTDGDGFPDEADVIGLGQQSFTWNYRAGDRVGVVAEGTSMIPVDEKSAYFKIMWGYMDVCDSTKVGLVNKDECDDSGDYGFGFLATESPSEQGDSKLKLTLSFSPETPLADPSDENQENISSDGTIADADQITVTSSLDNTEENPDNLYYTWQISKGDPQKDDWTEIKDISENFNISSPTAGMGISEFSFVPKKGALSSDSGINYFKVTLTASKASELKSGRGRSSVIIPVNTKGIRISLYKVDIQNGKAVIGDEVCTDGLYKTLCPAVKGQMLAAKVSGSHYKASNSEFSWKVNGSPALEPTNASELFSGWSDTAIFFPITKEEQEIESISVTATSSDELQPATGTRYATVVHPAVFIKSGDTSLSWPKTYIAEDPNQKATYQNIESSDAFEALTGNNVPYYLDFVPYYLLGEDANSDIDWGVNGTSVFDYDFYTNNPDQGIVSLENNNQTINLPTSATEGYFTTLSAKVTKYWSDEERGIAYTTWGVAPNTLSGESSISIETMNASTNDIVGAANTPGQILAAIGTHLPHYFMYLLRLVLTMAVMFIISSVFYGLTQKLNFSNDEE